VERGLRVLQARWGRRVGSAGGDDFRRCVRA